MRIDVKDRVKINGSWENYHTCLQLDASAFGAAATFWLDHLHEGDPVEIKGDLRVEKFNKRDGTPGMSTILEGDNGNAPYVKWLPKGFTPKKEEQPAPQVSDSQVDDEEPPF
jgi:single-stranded DNA-binding protein